MIEIAVTLGAALLWLLPMIAAFVVVDRLRDPEEARGTSLLAAYVLFYFFQILLVKVLALVGLLSTWPTLIAYLSISAAAAVVVIRTGFSLRPEAAGIVPDSEGSLGRQLVWGTAGVVIVAVGLFSLLVPSHIWDVQAYHMPMVAGYVQSESLTLGPTQDLRQVFRVNGNELQMLNLALLSGSDAWVELPNALALIISLAATYELARVVLGDVRLPYLVVALTLTAPQILYGSVTAKNDIVFLALILCSFYWAVQIAQQSDPARHRQIILIAVAGGLAIATKVMGINVVGTIGLVFLILAVLRRIPLRIAFSYGLITTLAVATLVGDVYWSNLDRAEMPVGIRPGEVRFHIGLENLVEAFKFYAYDLSFRRLLAVPIHEHDFSHYGYVFPLLLVIGSYVGTRQLVLKRERRTASAMLAGLALVLFTSVIILRIPIQWDQRFMIWMVPTLGILAVLPLRSWSSTRLLAAIAFCSAIGLYNMAIIAAGASGGILQKSVLHLGRTGELASLVDVAHERYHHKIDGFDALSEAAESTDSVLYIGAEDTWMYPAWGRRFSRTVIGVGDSTDVSGKMQKRSFDFVVIENDAAVGLKRAVVQAENRVDYDVIYSSENRSILGRRRFSGSTSME